MAIYRSNVFSCRVIVALLIATLCQSSMAALIVYEGYNGYSTGIGALNGVSPNSNTIGLNQLTNYGGSGPAAFIVNPTSISFSSNYITSGGSISMSTNSAAVLAGQIDLAGPAPTGTLYASYLVNFGSHGGATGDGTHTRVANDTSTGSTRFQSYADSRSGTVTATGIAYGTTIVNSADILTPGTSYLMISSFTNVNTALSGSTTGVGNMYALTAEQYDNFLAAGALESYLNSTSIGSAANQITSRVTSGTATSGSFLFTDGNYAHFVTVGHPVALDELRYGTTLNAVVAAIPEPSTVALACIGIAYVTLRRTRRAV